MCLAAETCRHLLTSQCTNKQESGRHRRSVLRQTGHQSHTDTSRHPPAKPFLESPISLTNLGNYKSTTVNKPTRLYWLARKEY